MLKSRFLIPSQFLSVGQLFYFLLSEHGSVLESVLLDLLLSSVVLLTHLGDSFFVEVSVVDLLLEGFDFITV